MASNKRKQKDIPLANQEFALKQGLSEKEWLAINNGLGRVPNELECSAFQVLWSDKNSHKNSNFAFSKLDQSKHNQDSNITCITSINNLPLDVEPFFAAGACLGKALDQVLLIGGIPLAAQGTIILGHEESTYTQRVLKKTLEGLSWYANCVGVPVLNTEIYFDRSFKNNPLINVAVVIDVTGKRNLKIEQSLVGNKVYHLGTKAIFSNLVVYDPFEQLRLQKAMLGAIDRQLIQSFKIVGEPEIVYAISNLAKTLGKGLMIQLDKIPHVAKEVKPEELLFNQTPQQIIFVPAKGKDREVSDYFSELSLNITNIGEVVVLEDVFFDWYNYQIISIPYKLAIDGYVNLEINISRSSPMLKRKLNQSTANIKKNEKRISLDDQWVDLLANPNLSSRRLVYSHFDWIWGSGAGVAPETKAQVLKTLLNRSQKIALASSCNRLAVTVDSYLGTLQSAVECMRSLAEVGAKPVAISLSMNFGDIDNLQERSQFIESIRSLEDLSRIWKIPVVWECFSFNKIVGQTGYSGSPVVFMLGVTKDINIACSYYFKNLGDSLLLIGLTSAELTCSEYENYSLHRKPDYVSEIDLVEEERISNFVRMLVENEFLHSALGLSRGGLALALTLGALGTGRPIGASLKLAQTIIDKDTGPEAYMFSETSPRFLVSCSKPNEIKIRELAKEYGVMISGNGEVGGNTISVSGAVECSVSISTLNRVWLNGLNQIFERQEEVSHAVL